MTSMKTQSKSVFKTPFILDRDEIFKEFSLYKLNSSKSTSKLIANKSGTLDRSISNTSKARLSKGSNLIPIRTVNARRDDKNFSGRKTMNISQIDYNRSKERIYYNDIYKKINKEKEIDLERNNSGATIDTNGKIRTKPSLNLNSINTNHESNFAGKSRMRNNKQNVDIYDLYKACCSNSSHNKTEHSNNDYFSTIKNTIEKIEIEKNVGNYQKIPGANSNEKISKKIVQTNNRDNTHNSKENTTNFKSESSKGKLNNAENNLQQDFRDNFSDNTNFQFQNDNYEKYTQHLMDQVTLLTYKINEYKLEKDRLINTLKGSDGEKIIYIEKLEKEIKSYKNMIDSCVKTCSQLAEELMSLRKEIERYTSNSTTYSSISTGINYGSSNSNKSIDYKSSKSTSKTITVSPIKKPSVNVKKMKK